MKKKLHKYITNCLNGYCDFQDFESWLVRNLQKILDSNNETLTSIAEQIDADFIELNDGLIDMVTFREHLQQYLSLLDTSIAEFDDAETDSTTIATASSKTVSAAILDSVADLRLHHVFA